MYARFGPGSNPRILTGAATHRLGDSGRSRGEIVVGLALFGFALVSVVALLRRGDSSRGRTPRAPELDSRTDVLGLRGEVELAAGVRLVATVARLQASSERQQFDARALRRAFALSEGEPFACELDVVALEPRAADEVFELTFDRLTIEDANGRALEPIVESDDPARATTPLRTLLAAPDVGLRAGQSVRIVLWGRAPLDGARLTGLATADVVLHPSSIPRHGADHALARVDTDAEETRDTAGEPR